jgi:hypothetical protein
MCNDEKRRKNLTQPQNLQIAAAVMLGEKAKNKKSWQTTKTKSNTLKCLNYLQKSRKREDEKKSFRKNFQY